eukprot:1150993-Rhodomonas_salina.3
MAVAVDVRVQAGECAAGTSSPKSNTRNCIAGTNCNEKCPVLAKRMPLYHPTPLLCDVRY